MGRTEIAHGQGQATRQVETPAGSGGTRRHRAGEVPLVSAWLALGAGVVVLLALLTAELLPAIHALVRFSTAPVLTSDQRQEPREEESLGLVPVTIDDFFAHL